MGIDDPTTDAHRIAVTFTFSITVRDLYRATRDVQHRQRSLYAAYAFFLGAPALLLAVQLARGLPVDSGPLLAGPLFVFGAVPLMRYWTVRSAFRGNPSLRGEQTFELTAERWETRGGLHTTSLHWDGVVRVVETREFFLFYVSKQMAYFLPKREVEREGRTAELRALIRSVVNERASLRA